MHGKFLLVGLAVILTLPHDASAQTSGGNEYVVAVLSPTEGPLREVGKHHDDSVKEAFHLENGDLTVNIGNHILRLLFMGTGDPTTDSTTCVEKAQFAVEEGAVAILGPVTSGCTERVLAQSLGIPVIASLATATDLKDPDGWFFRTIDHDRRRLKNFCDIARARGITVENSIAIHEPSVYGKGLLTHLMKLVPDIDADHTFRWDDVIEDATHGEIGLADAFEHTIRRHHTIENVFLLGSSNRTVAVVRALNRMFHSKDIEGDPNFVLVGSMPNTNDLPEDTWVIGEAQVSTSRNLITSISKMNPAEDLYISTFDASIALKEALGNVLAKPLTAPLTPVMVRRRLRDELENHSFSSSERGRTVEFANGEIVEPATTPLYRFSIMRELENPDPQESWVELRLLDAPKGHLEGPVVVGLIPHGEDLVGKEIELRVEGIGDAPETVQKVALDAYGTTVTFVPSFWGWNWQRWFPNSLTITTDQTREEQIKIAGLGWPASYLVAALTALLGALLYLRYKKERGKNAEDRKAKARRPWSYVDRCLAGVAIAFLIIHVGPLLEADPYLSHLPVPEFGSSWWVNAVVAGLMGGWLGLNPIVGLVSGVIAAFTPLFQSDS